MMNYMWPIIGIVGVLFGIFQGNASQITSQVVGGAIDAVALCVRLAGGFALWSGLIAILEKGGAMKSLARVMSPMLARLFPGTSSIALEAISTNLAANVLGLGNAATPIGIEAMKRMASDASQTNAASDSMIMFIVINASSVQLLPTTVVALRAASGSTAPAAIVGATIVSTVVSTIVGIGACVLTRKGGRA